MKFGKYRDPSVLLNSVDLSSFVRSATLNVNREAEDLSSGSDEWSEFTIGRGEWSVTLEFWQSYYTAEVDATLWGLLNSPGTGVTLELLPKATGGVSATNPKYSGTVFATSYAPLDGSYDQNVGTSITLQGTSTLTRATS